MLVIAVAYARNRVIGYENKLPWHLPADLKMLKALSMGKTVIFGRKTLQAIGGALFNRHNIVLTRDKTFFAKNITVINSIDEIVLRYKNSAEECFVFGGEEVYCALLPFAQKIYCTVINAEFSGDRFFPEISPWSWELVSWRRGVVNEQNIYEHCFCVYRRKIIKSELEHE